MSLGIAPHGMAPKTRSVSARPTPNRNASRQPWSQEELKRLAEAVRNKMPRDEIVELMSPRTEHAVEHKMRELKAEAGSSYEREKKANVDGNQVQNDIKDQVRRKAQDQIDNWTDNTIQTNAIANEDEELNERGHVQKSQIPGYAVGQVTRFGNSLPTVQAIEPAQPRPAYSMDLSTTYDPFSPDENGRIDTGYGHVGKNNGLDDMNGLDFTPMVEPANTPSGLAYVGPDSDNVVEHK